MKWPAATSLHPSAGVVAICGSTRFRADIACVNRERTLAGWVVLAPAVFGLDGDEVRGNASAAAVQVRVAARKRGAGQATRNAQEPAQWRADDQASRLSTAQAHDINHQTGTWNERGVA